MSKLPSPAVPTELTPGKVQAYMNSKENFCLMPDTDFGRRKYFSVPMSRQFSLGKNKNQGNKQWVHPPEALLRGHIVYNVKFLGHVEVEQPKGTDVVKEAIRKMKFNKHLKRAEGQKPPKVELTISADGVTIQEPKYKVTQHQYPLHRISYCADDKSDKRMFTFIAKEADNNTHHCFVFDSEKCAEEITLTIGQAFDLAYKRFLETSGKDMDTKKQFLLMQKKWLDPAEADLDPREKMRLMLQKVQQLTQENLELKARCADLERLIEAHGLTAELDKSRSDAVVGRKLENLIFDEESSRQSNGSAVHAVTSPSKTTSPTVPALAPPPPVPPRSNVPGVASPPPVTSPVAQDWTWTSAPTFLANGFASDNANVDLFGATPFNPTSPSQEGGPLSPPSQNAPAASRTNPFNNMATSTGDPFGMGSFNPASSSDLDMQIKQVDKELLDLETGFKSGLTIFSLEDLDPLNAK